MILHDYNIDYETLLVFRGEPTMEIKIIKQLAIGTFKTNQLSIETLTIIQIKNIFST